MKQAICDNTSFKTRDCIKIFTYSTLLLLLTFPLNGLSFGWSAIIGSLCYVLLAYKALEKYKNFRLEVIFFILAGRLWLEYPIRVFAFKDTLCSLMVTIFELWNIGMVIWYFKHHKSKVAIIIGIIGWVYFAFFGHPQWLEFAYKKEYSLHDLYSISLK